jgi:hypothetical protein
MLSAKLALTGMSLAAALPLLFFEGVFLADLLRAMVLRAEKF